MLTKSLLILFKTSFISIISVYGILCILTEIFTSIIPLGIFLTFLLTGFVYFTKIPPPTAQEVETIIGKDLHQLDSDVNCIKTVAHRGAGLDAPENSLIAFQMCKEKGCNAIEFDITFTSDEKVILFHDSTLERMADTNLIINNEKWDDLREIDISVKHPYRDRFVKTNIPTLEQTIQQLLTSGQKMFIDIKDNNVKMVSIILELYNKHPELIKQAIVTTFFPNLIYMIRRRNPKIVCTLAWRPHIFAYESYKYPEGKGPKRSNNWFKHYLNCFYDIVHEWTLSTITYYMLGLPIILLHKDAISPEIILKWRSKGVRVIAWTTNSPTEKQYFARYLKITYLTDTLTGESSTHGIHS